MARDYVLKVDGDEFAVKEIKTVDGKWKYCFMGLTGIYTFIKGVSDETEKELKEEEVIEIVKEFKNYIKFKVEVVDVLRGE